MGIPPHGTTPVAYLSTHDVSEGELKCELVDVRKLGEGVRWGYRLARLLELLLAG